MLLTLVSNIQLVSQETKFTFNSLNQIKYCGNQNTKELLITLDIGEIKLEDDLESINFEIEYDISNFRIDNVLTSQTLIEQFEFIEFSIANDNGLVIIDAGNTTIGKKVVGNKVFLALSGKFVGGDCTKDGFIRVNRVLFNDEYKRPIVNSEVKFISATFDTLNSGKYQITKNIDTIYFDTLDVVKNVDLNFSYDNNFEYFTSKISKKINDTYSINDIKIENINFVLAKNITEDSIEFKVTKLDKKLESFNLIFEINKQKLDTNTYPFELNEIKFEDCNCNLKSEIDLPFISQIKYNKDTTDTNHTSITSKRKNNIYHLNKNILKVNNIDLDLKNLKIWDIQGQLIHNFEISDLTDLICNLEQEKNKVIILQFIYKDNTYYTNKLIIQD